MGANDKTAFVIVIASFFDFLLFVHFSIHHKYNHSIQLNKTETDDCKTENSCNMSN